LLFVYRGIGGDALNRFNLGDARSRRKDRRPALTKGLVRRVGEELGYNGGRHRRHRPQGPIDTRLCPVIAKILAQRYREPHTTLLRTLVRPALRPRSPFAGFRVLSDEATIRKKARRGARAKKPSD